MALLSNGEEPTKGDDEEKKDKRSYAGAYDLDLLSETEELALIYRAKGLSKVEAEQLASRLTSDPDVALDSREDPGSGVVPMGSLRRTASCRR